MPHGAVSHGANARRSRSRSLLTSLPWRPLRGSYAVPSVAPASYQEPVPDLNRLGSGRPGPGPSPDSYLRRGVYRRTVGATTSRAVLAARRRHRDGAQALGAVALGSFLVPGHPRQECCHRLDDQEVDHGRDDQERDQCVEERAVPERAVVDRERSELKSGFPAIAAMSGVIRSTTIAVTTAVNAVPMTTAIASSTRSPRVRNSLKPFTYVTFTLAEEDTSGRMGHSGGSLKRRQSQWQ